VSSIARYVRAIGGLAVFFGLAMAQGTMARSWTRQPVPIPPLANGAPSAIGCSGPRACTAVGSYVSAQHAIVALAERWGGVRWRLQSIAGPPGTSSLSGVSCPSSRTCTAVGNYLDGAGRDVALVERWDGSGWHFQAAPAPAGARRSSLSAVACRSAVACVAVGTYRNHAGRNVTLAERSDGLGWQVEPTPNPARRNYNMLDGVSCPSATICVAVGTRGGGDEGSAGFAERWNGSGWRLEATPRAPGPGDGSLDAVSCPSVAACTAVGYYAKNSGVNLTLAERWDGSRWRLQTTPDRRPPGISQLAAVSCPWPTDCVAAGSYERIRARASRWPTVGGGLQCGRGLRGHRRGCAAGRAILVGAPGERYGELVGLPMAFVVRSRWASSSWRCFA
jgi:hypothetical protein